MLRKIFQRLTGGGGEPSPEKSAGSGSIRKLELRNEIGLRREWIEHFAAGFTETEPLERGRSAKLLRYLVDGENEDEVFAWLSNNRLPNGYAWFNWSHDLGRKIPLAELIAAGELTDPGFWLRYSKLMDVRNGHADRASWLRVFLQEVQGMERNLPAFVTTELITEMLRLDGLPPESALPHFLEGNPYVLCDIDGMAEYLSSNREAVVQQFSETKTQELGYLLERIGRLGLIPADFVDVLCDYACGPAKTVRPEAAKLIADVESVPALMLQKFTGGNPAERFNAFEYLRNRNLISEELHEAARKQLKTERSSKVKEAIEHFLGIGGDEPAEGDAEANAELEKPIELPPLPELPEDAEPPVECLKLLDSALEGLSKKDRRRVPAIFQRLGPDFDPDGTKPLSKGAYFLQADQFAPLVEHPDFTLLHLLRFARLAGFLSDRNPQGEAKLTCGWHASQVIGELAEARFGDRLTLRFLARHLELAGIDPKLLGWHSLSEWGGLGNAWPAERVWAYYAENPEFFENLFGVGSGSRSFASYAYPEMRKRAYAILSYFPAVPSKLVPPLLEIALGSLKTEMGFARMVLKDVPGLESMIEAHILSRKQETRSEAANWIAELGCNEAIPALKKVIAKEKGDLAKSAQLFALQALGESIEPWLSKEGMQKEAEAVLARYPADEFLPYYYNQATLTWKDGGEPVPDSVVQWLVVRSIRAKETELSPLLALYLDRLDPAPFPDFGLKLVETWIARGNGDMKVKGVLGLAAGMCDTRAVPIVESFLKKFYGTLAHQGKALMRMIGWIDSPMSIQLLLSVANRFRTKGMQDEARRIVSEIAERKGWTIDELGDRTIPDAGFDAAGEMALSYGPRTLHAILDDDLKISIRSDNGKVIKSLPAPRKDDDAEEAAESKRLLSLARKELKTVLRLQKDRLYEALCTQRVWRFDDWNTYLNHHPIVSRYCRSLVWTTVPDSDKEAGNTFRPLEDKTLTDLEDNEITLEADTAIRLAHRCNVSGEVAEGWVAHFADYEVSFLFEQFSKPLLTFEEEELKGNSYDKFTGYIVESLKLRSIATKLGYSRGVTEDGGWFYDYTKSFPSLGLVAVIEFSGNYVPEENREVVLHSLKFDRDETSPRSGLRGKRISQCRLSELPDVLVSECVNDLQTMAASGSGFDPDWEKRDRM